MPHICFVAPYAWPVRFRPCFSAGSANGCELGERDGLIGVAPRIDTHAYQCS